MTSSAADAIIMDMHTSTRQAKEATMQSATIFVTIAAKCGHEARAFAADLEDGHEYEAECVEGCGNVAPVASYDDRGAWALEDLKALLGDVENETIEV